MRRFVEAPSLQYDSCPSEGGVGGLFFEFEAIRTESRRDGPDAVRDGSKSTKRPPTACSPPYAIDATRKKINRSRNTQCSAQARAHGRRADGRREK